MNYKYEKPGRSKETKFGKAARISKKALNIISLMIGAVFSIIVCMKIGPTMIRPHYIQMFIIFTLSGFIVARIAIPVLAAVFGGILFGLTHKTARCPRCGELHCVWFFETYVTCACGYHLNPTDFR